MKKIFILLAIFYSLSSFSQEAISVDGKIKVYKEPPVKWVTNEGTIWNFKSTTKTQRYTLGFRDLLIPTIEEYKKLDTLYFDQPNDRFTYSIKDFTSDEILAYDQRKLDLDSSSSKNYNYLNDGQVTHKRIWDRIMREYDKGPVDGISENQFNTISNTLFDAILPLEFGRWKVAQSRVDATLDPSNAKLLAIKTKVQQIIDDYIAENY